MIVLSRDHDISIGQCRLHATSNYSTHSHTRFDDVTQLDLHTRRFVRSTALQVCRAPPEINAPFPGTRRSLAARHLADKAFVRVISNKNDYYLSMAKTIWPLK